MNNTIKLYPAIKVDLFADVNTFVASWEMNFPADDEYNFYLEHRYKNSLQKPELLRLFEWYNKRPLDATQIGVFNEAVAPQLPFINECKRSGDFNEIIAAGLPMNPLWLGYLAHLVGGPSGPPFFDEHIYRAYHYMDSGEINELPTDPNELGIMHGAYTCFYFDKATLLNYHLSDDNWDCALSAFGRFLTEYPNMFLL